MSRIGLDAFLDRILADLSDRLAALDPRQFDVPPRDGFTYRNPDLGLMEWMPSLIPQQGAAVKMVTYHPTNPRLRNLPTILASILIFDTRSGHLEGILDATFTTAVRTGAASALASRVLAEPGSRVLGVIGCGAQAVTQVHALSRIFPLERIIGFDVDSEARASFARRVAFTGIEVEMVSADGVEGLVGAADILCTCTSVEPGHGPVFQSCDVQPHLHINAVGSDLPGKFEIPVSILRRALVCPDFLAQARREGECQQLSLDAVGPDLVALVKEPHRFAAAQRQVTVFDSTGWALIDHLVAIVVLDLIRQHGLGSEVELECISADARDPYAFLDAASWDSRAFPDLAVRAAN